MTKAVFLDTGVLGIVTHPRAGEDARKCIQWLRDLLAAGNKVYVPEICDYELRRGYYLNGSNKALQKLEDLNRRINYVPINTQMMNRAAELWAETRRIGMPTADKKELDGDVILAAQALLSTDDADERVVATTNVGHLARFIKADEWPDIAVE